MVSYHNHLQHKAINKMLMKSARIALLSILFMIVGKSMADKQSLHALVWGDTTNGVTCDCADDLGKMITNTPGYNISYTIVGPDGTNFTSDLLQTADIFAYPGGPSLEKAWQGLEPFSEPLREWIRNGGRYIGSCLGAYLAGSGASFAPDAGLSILPFNVQSGQEITQPNAQVQNSKDTYIDVNWTFGSGINASKTIDNRTLYFQDGVVILISDDQIRTSNSTLLGRYSKNNDVAAIVSPFGKGFVGVTGVHLEADESWYQLAHFSNPQGVNLNYGYDLVATTLGSLGRNASEITTNGSTSAASTQNQGNNNSSSILSTTFSSVVFLLALFLGNSLLLV